MRQLAVILFFITIFCSCQNDPGTIQNRIDSGMDTMNHKISSFDTLNSDTTHGSKMVYDCSVLKRRVPSDTNSKQIQRDLQELLHCGLDSFDFLYVVPNLFPGWWSENVIQGNKNITYGDFMKHLNEFKISPAYAQLHQRVQTLDSLRSIPFDVKKVYAMKPVLGHLGFTEMEWEQFEGFSRTYPIPKKGVFTWGDMVEAFDKYKPQ